MKKLGNSIALRFIIVVLVILFIGQGLLWIWFLSGQKKQYETFMSDKAISAIRSISYSAAPPIIDKDYSALESIVTPILEDPDIMSVRFLDSEGRLIWQSATTEEKSESSLNPYYVPWTNKVSIPLGGENSMLGTVEAVYKGDRVNAEMFRLMTVPVSMQALVFFAIIVSIYITFQKSVGKRIDWISSRMSSVKDGDLTVRINDESDDEIGLIATVFDFLVESLSSTISKLYSTADNVAMAIKQLNLTFKNVNDSVHNQSITMDEIIVSVKEAVESQADIITSTEKLSGFSSENVTSLLQMRSASDEIVSNTTTLFKSVDDTYSIVTELSQTAKAITESSGEVLSSVEDTLASVEEISASVREIETSAKDSTILAQRVRAIAAESGVLTVADAIDGMDKISEKVKYSVDVVTRLGARSKDIEKMLSVIKEVTEQTNLLSLNAAILAVQAGEYGKGFSVVADEIRALSDRTAISTKEIAGIVGTIQKEIQDVVTSIEAGMHLVEEGSALVYTAGENIATVVEEAQKSARMAMSIQSATEEQAKGLGQITASVENIRTMITHVVKSTDEQFKANDYMLERLIEVRDIAESTKKGIEEQAAGIKLISRNIELATDGINDINKTSLGQKDVNDAVLISIEMIKKIGKANISDVDDMTLSLKSLEEEIKNLRNEMDKFKVR